MRFQGLFCVTAAVLILAVAATSLPAIEPCFVQLKPRLFYTGFENGDMSGMGYVPYGAWSPNPDNNAGEIEDLGCAEWALGIATSGYVWDNYAFQSSVRILSGQDCRSAGIHWRYHWTLGNPSFEQYYAFVLRGGATAALLKYDGISLVELASVPYPHEIDRWYVLRVQATGSNHTLYINGEEVLEWADPDYAVGSAGVIALGVHAWFDNVIGLLGINPFQLARNESPAADADLR